MRTVFSVALICLCAFARSAWSADPAYDPLRVDPEFKAQTMDLTVHDAKRNRDIPVRIYLPAANGAAPVVLFSHGLGGSREGGVYLGQHWAARGFLAIFLQHAGSDDAVWRDKPAGERMDALSGAASLQNFEARAADVVATLDVLKTWNADANGQLKGRLNLDAIGMAGHSFGAITTQAVSGEKFPLLGTTLTDPRIKAAIAMSPSPPRRGNVDEAFGALKIPWLLMTGTKDVAPIGGITVAQRLAVYPAMHGAPKYELVLKNAEHSAFTDRALPGDQEPRNSNHHRAVLALSTAFWDGYLRKDAEAMTWLNGAGPRTVMEAADQWESAPR